MSSERKMKNSRLYSKDAASDVGNRSQAENAQAVYTIQTFLALRAWRRQKHENDELKFNIKVLSDKVDALQMQRFALRQLLDAEKIRLTIINNDVHKILNNLEECRQEKSILLKEREKLLDRVQVLEEKFAGLESVYHNQKNDLLTAKLEAKSWEKQLEKEREKISKIRSEKKISSEQVQQVSKEESKEAPEVNNRKLCREARIKSTTCRTVNKNGAREKVASKIDFGKNK